MSHEFWLKISEKWFRAFEKWFRSRAFPLLAHFASKSGIDAYARTRYVLYDERQASPEPLFTSPLSTTEFSAVNHRKINMASEEPNPSTKPSQNGKLNRFAYQTSVLVTRPEWEKNIKSLLVSFQTAGLANHPNLRRSEDKTAWHQYLSSICYPSQPFHGIYDVESVQKLPKLRTAIKKKVLDILSALHNLAEKKRKAQENLSENERLGSKLHTTFTENVKNDTSRIEKTKNDAALLAKELIESEEGMNLRPPGHQVINHVINIVDEIDDDSMLYQPPIVRKTCAGLEQGKTDGTSSASSKTKCAPTSSSSLHFVNHESSISRPKRQSSGYTGQESKRRGLDAIDSLDKGTEQIVEEQRKLFPLIHQHILSTIPTEKELNEKKLMGRLESLVTRLNSLKASENGNSPMAVKIRNEIMIINMQLDV